MTDKEWELLRFWILDIVLYFLKNTRERNVSETGSLSVLR
jgi:hypothetical protein